MTKGREVFLGLMCALFIGNGGGGEGGVDRRAVGKVSGFGLYSWILV